MSGFFFFNEALGFGFKIRNDSGKKIRANANIQAEARKESDSLRRELDQQRIEILRHREDRITDKDKNPPPKGPSAGQEARLAKMLEDLDETVMGLPQAFRSGAVTAQQARTTALTKVKYAPLPDELKESYRQAVEETIIPLIEEYEDEQYQEKVNSELAIPRAPNMLKR